MIELFPVSFHITLQCNKCILLHCSRRQLSIALGGMMVVIRLLSIFIAYATLFSPLVIHFMPPHLPHTNTLVPFSFYSRISQHTQEYYNYMPSSEMSLNQNMNTWEQCFERKKDKGRVSAARIQCI